MFAKPTRASTASGTDTIDVDAVDNEQACLVDNSDSDSDES
jgi:hypothetical protein